MKYREAKGQFYRVFTWQLSLTEVRKWRESGTKTKEYLNLVEQTSDGYSTSSRNRRIIERISWRALI